MFLPHSSLLPPKGVLPPRGAASYLSPHPTARGWGGVLAPPHQRGVGVGLTTTPPTPHPVHRSRAGVGSGPSTGRWRTSRPGKRGGAGARLAEAAGECAARRSQELTLLAGGSCSRCTSGSGLGLYPRPPPGLALPSRNAGSASRICSVFLGAAGVPSGAWPGAGGGRRPARISCLLPPPAAGVAPGQAPRWAAGWKGPWDVAFSPGAGDLGTSCLAPIAERGKLRPGPRASPVVPRL